MGQTREIICGSFRRGPAGPVFGWLLQGVKTRKLGSYCPTSSSRDGSCRSFATKDQGTAASNSHEMVTFF